jgi:hypothetical protein
MSLDLTNFLIENKLDPSLFNSRDPFLGEKGKYHYNYIVTNKINSKIYYGKHSSRKLNNEYLGSGTIILKSIEKYGSENFEKVIVHFSKTSDDAFEMEKKIVNEEFLKRTDVYNIKDGGIGGFDRNKTTIRNKITNKNYWVLKTDPRVISDEYENFGHGKATVKDISSGKNFKVNINDSRFKTGEIVGSTKGKSPVKDVKTGKMFLTSSDDPRFKTGEIYGIAKGKFPVRNIKTGERFLTTKNDPRLLTGEIVSTNKDRTVYKQNDGSYVSLNKNDPRIQQENLQHMSKGKVNVYDENGKILMINNTDPKFLDGTYKSINLGKIHINNGIISKSIFPEDLKNYDDSWKLGQYINKQVRVHKDKICISINEGQLQEYLNNGWFRGSNVKPLLGRITVNNGINNKFIKEEQVKKFLEMGWKLGLYKKRGLSLLVHKDSIRKRIFKTDLPKYLAEGWKMSDYYISQLNKQQMS